MAKGKESDEASNSKLSGPARPKFGEFLSHAVSRSSKGKDLEKLRSEEDWEITKQAFRNFRLRKDVERLQTEMQSLKMRQLNGSLTELKRFTHSPDYRSVTVRERTYTLTARQAQFIEVLHSASEGGNPDVSIAHILERLETQTSRWQDTFKSNPEGKKALVKSGARKGTLRLNL
jgi:hypothetical protein